MLGNIDQGAVTHVNSESPRAEATSVWRYWVRSRERAVAFYHVLFAYNRCITCVISTHCFDENEKFNKGSLKLGSSFTRSTPPHPTRAGPHVLCCILSPDPVQMLTPSPQMLTPPHPHPRGLRSPVPDLFQQGYILIISKLASSRPRDVHDVSMCGHQDNSERVLQLASKC